jgi:four helix bundle protein
MAYYENLPIYRKAMELAIYIEQIVRDFSRYHKYAIGHEIRMLSKELVKKIIQANSLTYKTEVLRNLRDSAEELKMNILICKEIKAFKNFNQFEKAANLTVNICRQCEGWLKSQKGKGSESRHV